MKKTKFFFFLLSALLVSGNVWSAYTQKALTTPLCFTANTAGSTIKLSGSGSTISLSYSLDNSSWSAYTIGAVLTLPNVGDKVYFKASATNTCYNGYKFVMTGSIAASGNIMSLLYEDFSTKTTIPSASCFKSLFYQCTSLTTAPALPAITLANYCYQAMFQDCSGLLTAPALPATTLQPSCYKEMFWGCGSLTAAPNILPAKTLETECYGYMFYDHLNITQAPELPAASLVKQCYDHMFYAHGTNKMNYIKCLATSISAESCTSSWVGGSGWPSSGTFVVANSSMQTAWDGKATSTPFGTSTISGKRKGFTYQNYTNHNSSVVSNPLCFTTDGAVSVTLKKVGSPADITIWYSFDKSSWNQYTMGKTINLANGSQIYFIAGNSANSTFSTSTSDYYQFVFGGSGTVEASGTIMSLLNASCTSSTTLPSYCFYNLFNGCTQLTTAPELPATTLTSYCYGNMFYGCTNLEYIKCSATSGINTNGSTSNWTYNVAPSGDFVSVDDSKWPAGENGNPWKVVPQTKKYYTRPLKEEASEDVVLGTLCLKYDVTTKPDDVNFYTIAGKNGIQVYFKEVTGDLVKGKAYLFETTNKDLEVELNTDDSVNTVDMTNANGFIGTFDTIRNLGTDKYVIADNKIKQCSSKDGGTHIASNRAYIILEDVKDTIITASAPERILILQNQDYPTSVETLPERQSTNIHKVMLDGKLYIMRGKEMYNLQGQLIH